MFEDSRAFNPTQVFPDLAAAIEAIPVRPDRSAPAVLVTGEARALLVLCRQLQSRLLSRVAAIDTLGLAEGEGFTTAASWLRGYGNVDQYQAAGTVKAARLADRLPELGGLLAVGKIGVEHLQAVTAGARTVPTEVIAQHERTLRNLAPHARPSDLRRAGEKIRACYDHDASQADAAYRYDSRQLSLSRTFDERWHLDGILDSVGGAALQAALESLMTKEGPEDTRTVTQRRADALIQLTELGLTSGGLPQSGGDRPRLTFLVRTDSTHPGAQADTEDAGAGANGPVGGSAVLHAALAGLLHRIFHDTPGATTGEGPGAVLAGSHIPAPRNSALSPAAVPGAVFDDGRLLIGSEALMPAATVERICCDAAINLMLTDRWDEPLNLGRSARSHSPAQARAVIARDRHCVFPGCDTAPARCQIHHLIFWSGYGKTDTINLALVCWFHHHLIHEGGWALHRSNATDQTNHNDGGPPGWLATAPDGHQLHQPRHRQPAA